MEETTPVPENSENTTEQTATEIPVEETAEPPAETAPEKPKKQNSVEVNGKPLTLKQHRINTAKSWLFLIIGALMMAACVYFFQAPNNFTLGGIAGLAIILSAYIPLSQAVLMLIFNVALIIIGLIILGKLCTIKTIVCSLLYTLVIWLLEYVVPLEGTLTTDPFMELCYAILLFGVGGALIFNSGGSSGGTDIIALILKKFSKINVGIALMIVDLAVLLVSIFTFKDTATALFSFLGLFAKSFLLDGVIENMGKSKYLTIITKNPDDISEFILKVIQHGYTMYDAEGGYTGEKKKVMITVCKRSEALRIKMKVKSVDPNAFVIITDANEILGKGFGGGI